MHSRRRTDWALSGRVALIALLSFNVSESLVLASIDGQDLIQERQIHVAGGMKGTVVIFLSARCRCSNAHIDLLRRLAEELPAFSFVAVHSNADEPAREAKNYFQGKALPFPVLEDVDGKLADRFRAYKTPHVFVLGVDSKVLFRGGVTASSTGSESSRQYLREALIDAKEGRPVRTPEARTLGCVISRGVREN